MRAHILRNHPLLKVDEIAPTNREKTKDLYTFTCDFCLKSYCHEKNLKEHKKIAYAFTKTIEILISCTFCSFTASYKIIDEHYLKEHNTPQNIIKLEFKNIDEFESWIHEIQVSNQSYFVKNCGSSDTKNQIYNYYKCNRNVFFLQKAKVNAI